MAAADEQQQDSSDDDRQSQEFSEQGATQDELSDEGEEDPPPLAPGLPGPGPAGTPAVLGVCGFEASAKSGWSKCIHCNDKIGQGQHRWVIRHKRGGPVAFLHPACLTFDFLQSRGLLVGTLKFLEENRKLRSAAGKHIRAALARINSEDSTV